MLLVFVMFLLCLMCLCVCCVMLFLLNMFRFLLFVMLFDVYVGVDVFWLFVDVVLYVLMLTYVYTLISCNACVCFVFLRFFYNVKRVMVVCLCGWTLCCCACCAFDV